MASRKQVKANQENGKLGGVKTEAGKDISKYNALKHGILRETIMDSEAGIYESFYEEMKQHYEPTGIMEKIYVERIAILYVKLFRLARAENYYLRIRFDVDMFDDNPLSKIPSEFQNVAIMLEGKQVSIDNNVPKVKKNYIIDLLNIYCRYEMTLERRLMRTMHELERIQRIRKGENIPVPISFDLESLGSFGKN